MKIELPKSVNYHARIVSEKLILEIIYQLEVCNPHSAANLAYKLKNKLAK